VARNGRRIDVVLAKWTDKILQRKEKYWFPSPGKFANVSGANEGIQ
jgi:hypothetical protein